MQGEHCATQSPRDQAQGWGPLFFAVLAKNDTVARELASALSFPHKIVRRHFGVRPGTPDASHTRCTAELMLTASSWGRRDY